MPDLTVDRDAFLPVLANAARVVDRKNTIPILANAMLAVEADRLSLTASDLDIEITQSCSAKGSALTTVPVERLHDIVRKLPEGCELTLSIDDKACQIRGGRSRFTVPVLPVSDFPVMAGFAPEATFEIDAASIASMLGAVGFAISTEETRYYLNGIFLDASGETLDAVATDGHRLSKFPLPRPKSAAAMPAVILPRRTVSLIEKILPTSGPVQFGVSKSRISIEIENGPRIVSKLIDGTYPDYRRVVPTGNDNRFLVDRAALHAAVDRMLTVTSGKGSAIRFAFDEGEVKLSAASPEVGSAEETVPVECQAGQAVEIGFNGRYCLDMLSAARTETITFELGAAGEPGLMRPVTTEETGRLFVIMPMRV